MHVLFGRMSQNALAKLASELIGRLAVFGVVLLAARRLTEADFGSFNYALALGFVLAQLADLGLQMVVAREIASSREGDAGVPNAGPASGPNSRLVGLALQLKLLFSVVVVSVLWAIAARSDSDQALALFVLSLVPLVQTYVEFAGYIFRGQQRVATEARLLAAARLVAAGLGALALVLGLGLAGLAASQLLAALLFTVVGIMLLRRDGWLQRLTQPLAVWEVAASRREAGFLFRQSLPLGVAIFLSIAYTRLAILMLGRMSSAVAVAHYSAATRLVEPAQLIPASLMAAAFPVYTQTLYRNTGDANALGRRVTAILAGAGLAAAVFLWLAAPLLIPLLYGPEYAESIRVLQVSGLAIPLMFVNYSLTHYLIARGQQSFMGVFTGLMLLIHIGLSWLLIPRLGAVGPAVSILAAESFLLVGCSLALWLSKPRLVVAPLSPGYQSSSPPA